MLSRVIEVGTAYVESLKALIIAVRGLLLFIVLTVISAALAFATLYKWDNHAAVSDRTSLLFITETFVFRIKIWKHLVLSLDP